MSELLINEPGRKVLLLGNEALVRGALEAGMAFASCYPGTPSSEVPNTLFAIKEKAGIYMQFSTNEKVAMEAAGGAAIAGVRSLTAMKHVGMNVASDPMMTLAYTGVRGSMKSDAVRVAGGVRVTTRPEYAKPPVRFCD